MSTTCLVTAADQARDTLTEPGQPAPTSLAEQLRLAGSFWPYLRPRWLIVLLAVCTALAAVTYLPVTFLPKVLTEHAGDRTYLALYLLFALGALVLGWVVGLLQTYWGTVLGEEVVRTLRGRIFGRLESLTLAEVAQRGPGEFIQQIDRDVMAVRDLFDATLLRTLTDLAYGVAVLAALLVLDPLVTSVVLVLLIVAGGLTHWLNRRVEGHAEQARSQRETLLGKLVEFVGGFRDVLATGRFRRFAGNFDNLLLAHQRSNVRTAVWGQLAGLVPTLLLTLAMLAVYSRVLLPGMALADVGGLITYALLLAQLLPALHALTELSTELAMAAPSLRALQGILDQPEKPAVPARSLAEPIQSIVFEDVTFAIENRVILERVSLALPVGKLTALVGPSGAGKTTIAHLLLGLLKPTSGVIRLNGEPLDHFTPESVRAQIGFLPQQPFIFNSSLEDNIRFALADDPADEELQGAVARAQLQPLVEQRGPQGGLQATAGYLGQHLSGGEKQRVALARLLLRDPPIIVCDEYTANLDPRTARLIQDLLRTLFAGRTRVLITHELYTVRDADWVIIVDQGRVVQQGPPAELAVEPGLFREMVELQRF